MKRKTEASPSEDLSEVQHKLASKLKGMAYVFFSLSLAALLFAFFAPEKEEQKSSLLLDIEAISGAALLGSAERSPQEIFNFYAVSLLFFTIGIPLYYFSSKKTKLPNSESSSKMQLMPEEE